MKIRQGIIAVTLLGLVLAACSTTRQTATRPAASSSITKTDPVAFHQAMRKLWEDHITWTRLYIVDALDGSKEAPKTAERLLANQTDIGNAIKPYYGEAAGTKLTALLRQHILGAADLLTAAKVGNTARVTTVSAAWYANANEIATFLSSANPSNWPIDQLKMMMKDHLDLTLGEAVAHLKGNYAADIAGYDKVHAEILQMSDALASGIIAQFPDRFSAPSLPDKQAAFHQAMRKLWEDHITWTRLYIVDALDGSKEAPKTAERLLANQTDIGNAITPYYGEAAGNKLTSLLRQHILGAADLLTAAKAGDNAAVNKASAAWYANAKEIATFLSSANPSNWPVDQLTMMMKVHLDLTLAEAVAHLKGNYAADIAGYDKVHAEILQMSDALSSGIIAQFPDRF